MNQLKLGPPSGPPLQRYVMSFQRSNLHLSVSSKPSSTAEINFRGLIKKAQEAHAAGRRLEATLVYVQTKKEADDVHGVLVEAGMAAAK